MLRSMLIEGKAPPFSAIVSQIFRFQNKIDREPSRSMSIPWMERQSIDALCWAKTGCAANVEGGCLI